jgi:hypothetical protein
MEIDIVVIGDFESTNGVYNIEALAEKLMLLGFRAKILHDLPLLTQDKYILLFNSKTLELSIEYSRCTILMNTTLNSIFRYIKKYDFAAFVEIPKYIQNIPILCGKANVSGKSSLICTRKFSDEYGFIKDRSSKGIVELIINYLTEYEALRSLSTS